MVALERVMLFVEMPVASGGMAVATLVGVLVAVGVVSNVGKTNGVRVGVVVTVLVRVGVRLAVGVGDEVRVGTAVVDPVGTTDVLAVAVALGTARAAVGVSVALEVGVGVSVVGADWARPIWSGALTTMSTASVHRSPSRPTTEHPACHLHYDVSSRQYL